MVKNKLIAHLVKWLERLDARISAKGKKENVDGGESTLQQTFRTELKQRNRKLTTAIGKHLDSIGYGLIARLIISHVLLCAFLYWFFDLINSCSISDALYFSVITFTSLGYGDVLPTGIGKLVASFEVLSGIVLVAIFVGKLASERQSALLLLLYTSEHQRRLNEFALKAREFVPLIDDCLEKHDHQELIKTAKGLFKFLSSIHNYLVLQANQGGLAHYGNNSTLRRLYKAFSSVHLMAVEAIHTFGVPLSALNHLERSTSKLDGMAKVMLQFHAADPKTIAILMQVNSRHEVLGKWIEKRKTGTANFRYRSLINAFVVKRVSEELPENYKVKGVERAVADKLGLTVKMVRKVIEHLEAESSKD